MSAILPGHMKFASYDSKMFLTHPMRLIDIHNGTVYMINFLDLPPIPEPNMHLIIAKLVMDMQLPG